MLVKRTKTTELYILPEEFDTYTKKGFVIFVSKPTAFGTFKAVKVEMVKIPQPKTINHFMISDKGKKSTFGILDFWNNFILRNSKWNLLNKKVAH